MTDAARTDGDPKYIWLAPKCADVDRCWCSTPEELECEECGAKPIAYVRAGKPTADLIAELTALRAELEAAKERAEKAEGALAVYHAQDELFNTIADIANSDIDLEELDAEQSRPAVTDETVERAAIAICDARLWPGAWQKANEVERGAFRFEARAAPEAR